MSGYFYWVIGTVILVTFCMAASDPERFGTLLGRIDHAYYQAATP